MPSLLELIGGAIGVIIMLFIVLKMFYYILLAFRQYLGIHAYPKFGYQKALENEREYKKAFDFYKVNNPELVSIAINNCKNKLQILSAFNIVREVEKLKKKKANNVSKVDNKIINNNIKSSEGKTGEIDFGDIKISEIKSLLENKFDGIQKKINSFRLVNTSSDYKLMCYFSLQIIENSFKVMNLFKIEMDYERCNYLLANYNLESRLFGIDYLNIELSEKESQFLFLERRFLYDIIDNNYISFEMEVESIKLLYYSKGVDSKLAYTLLKELYNYYVLKYIGYIYNIKIQDLDFTFVSSDLKF